MKYNYNYVFTSIWVKPAILYCYFEMLLLHKEKYRSYLNLIIIWAKSFLAQYKCLALKSIPWLFA